MTANRFSVTAGKHEVVGVLHLPERTPSACVVACHGMGASKDSDKYLHRLEAMERSRDWLTQHLLRER